MSISKQEQIEQIAKVLYGHYCGKDKCGKCKMPNCQHYIEAKRIVTAGFGDIRKFAQDIKYKIAGLQETTTYDNKEYTIRDIVSIIIDKLVKEYSE